MVACGRECEGDAESYFSRFFELRGRLVVLAANERGRNCSRVVRLDGLAFCGVCEYAVFGTGMWDVVS